MYTKISATLVVALLSGCGASGDKKTAPANQSTQPGNTDTTNPATAPTASLLLNDEEAAGQTVSAQIDTAISAAAAENEASASGASLDLVGVDKKLDFQRSRTCTETNNQAVVDIKHSIVRDVEIDGPRRTLTNDFEAYREITRTWSKAGGEIKCAADNKHADIKVPDLAGVALAETLKEDRSRSQSLTNKKTNKSVTRSYKFSVDGTRNVSWKTVTNANGLYEITKEATHKLTRDIQVTKKDGTTTSFTADVANADGAPFEITVERDATTLDVKSRTVASGTLEATHKDGTRVETVFKAVKYDVAADDKCIASSGEIDGSIFKKGETTASLTFTITFGDSPTITFSNGKTVDYSPDGCEFDEPNDKATDAAKSAITPPTGVTPAPATDTGTGTATATAAS